MAKTNKGRKFFATTATAALVASAIVPVASAAQVNDFNSIASYAQEAVQDLVDRGVITGDQNGNFQPRKSVSRAEAATILSGALGLTTTDAIYFKDVKSGAWYYDAINAAVNNRVFSGKGDGIFDPNGNLTRGEAAVILVSAFNLTGKAPLAQFADEKSVKEWAKESLEIAVGNGVVKGDNGRIKANDAITKQDFAVMFARAEEASDAVATHTVKAINSTTVEVTFADPIADVKALDFKIEGLEVKNAVVKQTDAKTAVLTTAEQTAGTEYNVTVDGVSVGKFTGVSAVIPTAINVTTTSVQGVIGQEVTLKAQVTVAEGQSKANVPVTFNIVSDNTNINSKVEAEALTDENGVATYTYTRYYAHNDSVAAYATKKSSVVSSGKVYWANKIQLAVSEITTGNDLANNTKKTYKVNGKANTTYYVTVKENIGVTPDKVTNLNVQTATGVDAFVVPAELSTGGNNVVATVRTDADGEGTFTVYGSNLTATPVVYDATTVSGNVNSAGVLVDDEYSKTALQAEAPAVKYAQVDKLALTVTPEGTANSAEYAETPVAYDQNSVGGRTYTVTVTDKDGKVAPEGTTAYVTFEDGNFSGDVYFTTAKENFKKVTKDTPYAITVGKDGKATFRVAGKGATTFAKPTVFLNTAGDVTPVALNKGDIQKVSEATYFKSSVVKNATLTVKDKFGRTVTSLASGEEAFFTYQSVDQNGFAYRPAGTSTSATTQTVWVPVFKTVGGVEVIDYYKQETRVVTPGTTAYEYTLAFDVTSLFGTATVKDAAGKVLNASQNQGNTRTYQVKSDGEGKAIVSVTSSNADTVTVNVTGSNNILPTTSASVSFTNSAAVPAIYTGVVESINSSNQTLKFVGKNPVSYGGDKVVFRNLNNQPIANADDFAKALVNATGTVEVTYEVKDGVTTFYIYKISADGTKPADTATAPTVTASLVDTDLDANEIGGVLTISATNSAVSSVTVDGTALIPVNGVYTVAENTPANAVITVNVVNAVGKTASTTVSVRDVVGTAEKAALIAAAEKAVADATVAKTNADAAVTAAQTAKTNADAALTAAQTAKTNADAAVTAAQTAKTNADAALANNPTDSVLIAAAAAAATDLTAAEATAAKAATDLTAAEATAAKAATDLTAAEATAAKAATALTNATAALAALKA